MLKLISTAALAAVIGVAANAETIRWETPLSGANEVPANSSSGVGFADFVYDTDNNTFAWGGALPDPSFAAYDGSVQWFDLSGPLTGAHIHFGRSDENGPVFIDLIANSDFINNEADGGGSMTGSVILTDAEETEFLNGSAYVNLHTEEFPGGEIRGQLFEADAAVSPIPVPAGLPLALTGLAALGFVARRRK